MPDFTGWFCCGDGVRCDPFTVTDAYSRYLLCCRATEKSDGVPVRAVIEAVFREYGLPEAILTDNGAPFASRASGVSESTLDVWLQLDIRHERIEPGYPEQNRRHERMHRTLKRETASPPAADSYANSGPSLPLNALTMTSAHTKRSAGKHPLTTMWPQLVAIRHACLN